MKLKDTTTIVRLVLVAGLVALTLSLSGGTASVSAADQNGQIHVTKKCPGAPTGAPGGSCVITSSNLAGLNGAQVLYDQAYYLVSPADATSGFVDSNVVVDAGGGNRAIGRCTIGFQTFLGLCTFSDGTGEFAGFEARVDVDCRPSGSPCTWEGTYSFRPRPRR
jgi:hypothetical protein